MHTEEIPEVPSKAGPTGEQAEADDAKSESDGKPAPKRRVRSKKPAPTIDQVQAAWKLKETRGLFLNSWANIFMNVGVKDAVVFVQGWV